MQVKYIQVAPVFAVANVKNAIAWYEQALGLSVKYINKEDGDETGDSWNYALLHRDAMEIHLAVEQENDDTLNGASNCYLFLSNLDDLHNHLKNMPADVSDIKTMPWGHRECFLDDSYGNRIVLSEIPEQDD